MNYPVQVVHVSALNEVDLHSACMSWNYRIAGKFGGKNVGKSTLFKRLAEKCLANE